VPRPGIWFTQNDDSTLALAPLAAMLVGIFDTLTAGAAFLAMPRVTCGGALLSSWRMRASYPDGSFFFSLPKRDSPVSFLLTCRVSLRLSNSSWRYDALVPVLVARPEILNPNAVSVAFSPGSFSVIFTLSRSVVRPAGAVPAF
jgi:hypothetical protein